MTSMMPRNVASQMQSNYVQHDVTEPSQSLPPSTYCSAMEGGGQQWSSIPPTFPQQPPPDWTDQYSEEHAGTLGAPLPATNCGIGKLLCSSAVEITFVIHHLPDSFLEPLASALSPVES